MLSLGCAEVRAAGIASDRATTTSESVPGEHVGEVAGECVVRPGTAIITEPTLMGTLAHPDLVEVSGMAFSRRRDDVLWMVNDSGNGSGLYAVGTDGSSLGRWSLDAYNYDWEDMASVWVNGDAYLLIADVGDNRRARRFSRVDVFREPELGSGSRDEPLRPVATIRFEYEGGAENVEGLATDGQHIYFATKVKTTEYYTKSSTLFRIPFYVVPDTMEHVAERLGELPLRAPALPEDEVSVFTNVRINEPTALDFHENGRVAYMLTYRNVVAFEREEGQTWEDVLMTGGRWVHTHSLPQAEAMAIGPGGTVWFTSELSGAELWALPPHSR